MRAFPACLLLVAGLLLPLPAAAQDSRDPYQAGVGAYSAGRYDQADERLSVAIDQSPRDPRAYFYRGLSRIALGQQNEGMDDLRQGATLELAAGYTYATIDRALASVQGQPRQTIEQVRREMRRAAEVTRRTELAEARRAERGQREQQVLRTRHELPIEALVNQLTPDQALAAAHKSRGLDEALIASAETPGNALARSQPAPTGETDPFAGDDGGDPFATEDEAGAAMTAEAPEVVADTNTPFAGNPFLEGNPQGPPPQQQPPVAGGAAPGAGEGVAQAEAVGGFFRWLGKVRGGGVGSTMDGLGGGLGGGGFAGPPPGMQWEAEEGMTAEEQPDPFGEQPIPFGEPTPDDSMMEEGEEMEPAMEEEEEDQPVSPFGGPMPNVQGNEGTIGGGANPFSVE